MDRGVAAGVLAFCWWGVFPLYFRLLPGVPPLEVLANRIVWSLLLVLALLLVLRRWAWLGSAVRRPRVLGLFAATALLLSLNWITYIWAVSNGHVVDASLGYFITPLVNVALGTTLLGERQRTAQWLALGLAATGVVWLTASAGALPWIGLVIGLSFGGYGLLRKIASLGPIEGLALETMLLAPFAFIALALWWAGSPTSFPAPSLATNLWLIGLGPMTTVPLLLFATAARRMSMTTLGLLQYLGPTIQFVIGLALFGETLTSGRITGFAFIWAALVVYSGDGWRTSQRPAPA